jgi:hypothetical protein
VQDNSGKTRTELEINEEMTKPAHRGSVYVVEDIGNNSRGTWATTR